ncbi:MAG: DUF2851 family protein [Nitrospiraceae bacterium]|nr:DUF2851 family protein [Nitrospiraceae bacterium]
MGSQRHSLTFSEDYGRFRVLRDTVREGAAEPISETILQCVWYDQLFAAEGLRTGDGQNLRVLSPGWWNRSEGPDFQGAQIEFGGRLRTGDVEIHFTHGAWTQHGHHLDSRYDNVMLVVVLEDTPPRKPPVSSQFVRLATCSLGPVLEADLITLADRVTVDEYPFETESATGVCATHAKSHGPGEMLRLAELAGEWRMLNKARAMRERMERVGADQAVYEAFLSACGFSRYKQHFRAIAHQFHYDRVRQLGRQDALLLEAGLLQIAGLLPGALPPGTGATPHFARLRFHRNRRLSGLKSLPLNWSRTGVRPNNYPERRLAGAARFLARSAREGLVDTLDRVWQANLKPLDRRRRFEALFPGPMGFWASHCTWTGKKMSNPIAPLGAGRIRSIIGNVFVPAALAIARQKRNRPFEERVLEFFRRLPKEPDNHVLMRMVPRVLGGEPRPRLDFRLQQGLLQIYQDWCEANPSCRNCSVLRYLTPAM